MLILNTHKLAALQQRQKITNSFAAGHCTMIVDFTSITSFQRTIKLVSFNAHFKVFVQ